jgi:hypothetical protein
MNAQLSFLAGAISLAITSFSDDIPTGKTISCLIEAMTFDDEVITLTVTEPLDWSYANPRCWIQFQDGRPSTRLLTPTRVDDLLFQYRTTPICILKTGRWMTRILNYRACCFATARRVHDTELFRK